MPNNKSYLPLIVLGVLFISTIACGSSNTGEVVGQSSAPTQAAPSVQTYAVGDVVKVQDHTITLNSVDISVSTLRANFTIDNPSSSEITVSSLISFSAKDSEGTKLEQEIFDCGSSSLDGSILAGDKLRGDICWATTAHSPYRIYYEASIFGAGAIVWEVSE